MNLITYFIVFINFKLIKAKISFISNHFLIKLSIEKYRNCFILSFFFELKTNNVINIEFDIDQKVFHQIQKVKQMNELLRLLLSDFIFDINTKSRSLKSLWLKN